MSCEFQLIATLEGINKFIDGEKSDHDDGEPEGSRKTLQSFKLAVSPTGEIIVFARSSWLLICGSKWNSSVASGPKIKYSPNWHGHISCKIGEEITSLLCVPFFSQGQTSNGCADWTCIIVGFSSGCLRFYTEGMQELACSILHEEKITEIKCFCSGTTQEGKSQKQDNVDIYVLYKSVICVLNKSLLSQMLRQKRSELAKGIQPNKNEPESYLPLDFKKYSFATQEDITGACFLGQTLVSSFNTFDHLVTASLVGGFSSNYRASPPQTSLIVASGRRPFVGFHYTLEGAHSSVLTDVALAVASKVKNRVTAILPDWVGFGSRKPAQVEKPKEVSQEYAEKLSCRFGLHDLWRQGQSIIVSPDGTYSSVTDSLGRVTLIDNNSGVAVRMFKGYRDAQCGFIEVQESVKKSKKDNAYSKSQSRRALFIVIYAPKKGLIEIFTTQHGRRVTTFKVTKFGHLLYCPIELNTSTVPMNQNLSQNHVVFVSEEGFHEFSIPFHCALAEDNSKLSRDLHVLKKLKLLLKTENNPGDQQNLEEIEKCAKEFKTPEVKFQAIECMITYKNIILEAFKIVLKAFLEPEQSKDEIDITTKKTMTFAESTLNLLLFYEFLLNINQSGEKMAAQSTENLEALSEELKLPENELGFIIKFTQQIREIEKMKSQSAKVAFEEKKCTKLSQYLSCFDFESFLQALDKDGDKKDNEKHCLNLRSSNKEKNIPYLGEIFFDGIFNSPSCFDQWKKYVKESNVNPQDLALCLLSFWCNKNILDDVFSEVLFFIEVLKVICLLNDLEDIILEYNTESPWWKALRGFIAKNPFTIRGVFAALCCRSVTIFLEQERELSLKCEAKQSTKADALAFSNDWEAISKDSCQWDILLMQLQDLALLNSILSLKFKTQNSFPEVPFDFEPQCLTSIQASGTGRISELVAKWLVQFGFEPTALINPNDIEFQDTPEEKEVEKGRSDLIVEIDRTNEIRSSDENLNLALDYLALLKSRFPYSLTSSSILSNMCWEYFAHWFKNIDDLSYLESAVRYLEAIPTQRLKYGIAYLSWNTYLEQKFEILAKMINRIGKVPRDKLCIQEMGLRNDQVPLLLKLTSEILTIMLQTDLEDKPNFGTNREVIWHSSSSPTTSSLVFIALSQPVVNSDVILFQLQLCFSLMMISALNVKQSKLFSFLFDNVKNFSLSGFPQTSFHHQNVKLRDSRTEFLKKCLTAAVQTIEVVEYIQPVSEEECSEVVPTTTLKVEEYKKYLHICFELARIWALPLDDIKRHQICELYFCGFDRLGEEVIPSISDPTLLASQLLVIGGKRLKYLIQESKDLSKKMTKLSSTLSEWLQTLDLENFTYQGTIDDIEVLFRFTAKWLPEGHSDQRLAVDVAESLSFLKIKNS